MTCFFISYINLASNFLVSVNVSKIYLILNIDRVPSAACKLMHGSIAILNPPSSREGKIKRLILTWLNFTSGESWNNKILGRVNLRWISAFSVNCLFSFLKKLWWILAKLHCHGGELWPQLMVKEVNHGKEEVDKYDALRCLISMRHIFTLGVLCLSVIRT